MVAFIDQYRGQYGVESICYHLPIAPSTYYEHKARSKNPERCSARSRRDQQLKTEIARIWQENFQVYGARKIWHQLKQEGNEVARCTVERLMGLLNIQGITRGNIPKKTVTAKDNNQRDLVNRQVIADRPNQLWVADFTFVPKSRGCIYVAFVVDVYARQIIGWKLSRSMQTSLVLGALEQALHQREIQNQLINHSDRGVQYLSVKYSEKLIEAGIDASVGSVGDSYECKRYDDFWCMT